MPRERMSRERLDVERVAAAHAGGHVVELAWQQESGVVAAASADGPIVVSDADTLTPRCEIAGHDIGNALVSLRLVWSPPGRFIATDDGIILITIYHYVVK